VIGDMLIRATIVAATLSYAVAEWLRFRRPAAWRTARLAWTAAAGLALTHSALAFHFRHGWSHRDALDSTAAQTAAVTGLDWSAGLYVNYAFLAFWTADTAYWWQSPAAYGARPPAFQTVRAMTFLFMFFNGAVVFAQGPTRWLGLACVVAAASAWYFRASEVRSCCLHDSPVSGSIRAKNKI
jgi:hypothetical protein